MLPGKGAGMSVAKFRAIASCIGLPLCVLIGGCTTLIAAVAVRDRYEEPSTGPTAEVAFRNTAEGNYSWLAAYAGETFLTLYDDAERCAVARRVVPTVPQRGVKRLRVPASTGRVSFQYSTSVPAVEGMSPAVCTGIATLAVEPGAAYELNLPAPLIYVEPGAGSDAAVLTEVGRGLFGWAPMQVAAIDGLLVQPQMRAAEIRLAPGPHTIHGLYYSAGPPSTTYSEQFAVVRLRAESGRRYALVAELGQSAGGTSSGGVTYSSVPVSYGILDLETRTRVPVELTMSRTVTLQCGALNGVRVRNARGAADSSPASLVLRQALRAADAAGAHCR